MPNNDLLRKLNILGAAAKYDASCASSGVERRGSSKQGAMGNSVACGICHSFTQDGRCVSLLKVLQSNDCVYDCKYCVNRRTNDVERATFMPREIAMLTYEFYRRNYIEGLFLSSAVILSPDNTMEIMYETLRLLRQEFCFYGYIHVKAIPGADPLLIERAGRLADRMSVNIELPSEASLTRLAPQKKKRSIFSSMRYISGRIEEDKSGKFLLRDNLPAPLGETMPTSYGTGSSNKRTFVPGGQSTQLIIGATDDTDHDILTLTENLYNKMQLKRIYYSAYVPAVKDPSLPSLAEPPLLREHRLYQADWLLRFYGFRSSELLNERNPNLNLKYDPKCDWAVRNLDLFPVEVNKADYDTLLRVPGIGTISARKIVSARKVGSLGFEELKKMGVVLKRAQYFITCRGKMMPHIKFDPKFIDANLSLDKRAIPIFSNYEQLSLLDYINGGDSLC